MRLQIGLVALALAPLFAQQGPTPADLAAQSLQEATTTQDPTLKLLKLDEAYKLYQEVLRLDARNRDAYFSLAVIDWMKCHPALEASREQLKDAAARQNLSQKYGPIIEDGIENLDKALEIHPRYRKARVYRDRLIRTREEYLLWPQAPPPPPPPPMKPQTPTRIRVGGNRIQSSDPNAKRGPFHFPLTKVEPVYPPLALAAGVQGTVKLTAIIDKEGRVTDLRVVSGAPLLVEAAEDAARQWVYKPILSGGVPVEFVTGIEVPFVLPAAK